MTSFFEIKGVFSRLRHDGSGPNFFQDLGANITNPVHYNLYWKAMYPAFKLYSKPQLKIYWGSNKKTCSHCGI